MITLVYVILAVLALVSLVNIAAIWLTRKGLTQDENKNFIPDIIEDKFNKLKEEMSYRVDRVGEELKDVSKAIKEVGNQIGDIPKAATGKTRKGRKADEL